MTGPDSLTGRRVFVVEDDGIVALMVEDMLERLGCVVIGPFGTLGAATDAAQGGLPDIALLDVNVAGEAVYPLADLLDARGVKVLLLSGYGDSAIPTDKPHWSLCAKPFMARDLIAAMRAALAREAG